MFTRFFGCKQGFGIWDLGTGMSIFLKFLQFKKENQNFKNLMTPTGLEDQLRNEFVPYHETKTAIPEFEFLG